MRLARSSLPACFSIWRSAAAMRAPRRLESKSKVAYAAGANLRVRTANWSCPQAVPYVRLVQRSLAPVYQRHHAAKFLSAQPADERARSDSSAHCASCRLRASSPTAWPVRMSICPKDCDKACISTCRATSRLSRMYSESAESPTPIRVDEKTLRALQRELLTMNGKMPGPEWTVWVTSRGCDDDLRRGRHSKASGSRALS